jgi:prophage regulatory protein
MRPAKTLTGCGGDFCVQTAEEPKMSDRLLPYESLKGKGITLSKCQIWRLERAGKFPQRVYPSAGRVAWVESEIDAHLAACIAARRPRKTEAQVAA